MTNQKTIDGKNKECSANLRYCITSGDMDSIHGMSNYQVMTQEAQIFGFYADTGQGKGGQGGPGTGKHLLNTPGMSMEVVGDGLKVRNAGDITQLPAKIIEAKKGDIIIECQNGDITLRARNINFEANGSGNKDGQILIDGNRLIDIKAPDVKVQAEKYTLRATQEIDQVTSGFLKTLSGFQLNAQKSDALQRGMKNVLEKATTLEIPKAGEKLKAIAEKGKGFAEKVKGVAGDLEGLAEGLAENVDTDAIDQSFSQVGEALEEGDIGAATQNIQDALGGFLGGLQ